MSRWHSIALGLLIAACVAAFLLGDALQKRSLVLSAIASCVVSSTENADAKCLRQTIEALLQTHSSAEIMRYLMATSTPLAVSEQCHPIGHMVGALTYKKDGNIESSLSLCTSDCRAACVHGAIGAAVLAEMGESYPDEDIAHANSEQLEHIGSRYCAQSSAFCHGVGHIAYIATENEDEAVDICADISLGWDRESCYQGVFMERSGAFIDSLFPDAAHTRPSTRVGEYSYPCTGVREDARHACFLFLTAYHHPLFEADGLATPAQKLQKLLEVCTSLSGRDRASCFEGVGTDRSAFGFASVHTPDIQDLCANMPTTADKSACTLGIVPQFAYANRRGLFEYCSAIGNDAQRDICYDVAFQLIKSKPSADNASSLCDSDEECIARYTSFLKQPPVIDYRFGLYGA